MSEDLQLAIPKLVPVRGGWMAISAPGSKIRIGAVPAGTKEEAIYNFNSSLKSWETLWKRAQNTV